MATQLAPTEEAPRTAVAKASVAAGSALRAFIPTTLEEAWRLAGALASSGMTPKAYGNDQNKVMVGILAGAEVGLAPFAALQSIAVIGNNPSLWGDGMLGLVEASGLLEDFEETDDGEKATCRAVRKGRPTAIVRTFSMDDAKKAGLSGKAGPWVQYPARMRQMRARGFALRDGFPDVLRGLKSAEEVRDYTPMDGGTINRPAAISAGMLTDQGADEVFDAATGEVTEGVADPAAVAWVADHIAFVAGAADLERLAAVQVQGKVGLAKLLTSSPALHEKVKAAYAKRLDELEPETGRSDAEHGDQHDGADD